MKRQLVAAGLTIALAVVWTSSDVSFWFLQRIQTLEAQGQGGTIELAPVSDTYIGLNDVSNSTSTTLNTYTWPDNQVANGILMKFNVSGIPSGAVVASATLRLFLTDSDPSPDGTYNVTVHKVINKNPDVNVATGYRYNSSGQWTANACCFDNIPLAQADMSAAYATQAVDKLPGYKTWNVTALVQEWLDTPSTNFGLLVNSDPSTLKDRWRFFNSSEASDPATRPQLTIVLSGSQLAPVSDTYIGLNDQPNSASTTLNTYTWPDNQIANGILMKFNASSIPSGTVITNATLRLFLTQWDPSPDPTYNVTVHKVINKNPVVASATGSTYNGVDGWTPNSCCFSGFPLAQADISASYASRAVDKTAGYKDWDVTALVQEWVNTPSTNFGLLVNSDPSTVKDRWRFFASSEASDPATRPQLTINSTGGGSSGSGISANYPGDIGIEAHPDVIFVEDFEEACLDCAPAATNLAHRWTDVRNAGSMALRTGDVPPGSQGQQVLDILSVNNGGSLYKKFCEGPGPDGNDCDWRSTGPVVSPVNDTIYVRYYIKYDMSAYSHTGAWVGGYNPLQDSGDFPPGIAGTRPNGSDFFVAATEQNIEFFDYYNYWMGMHADGAGSYWGNYLLNNPNVQEPGKGAAPPAWLCVEHMVKLNNVLSSSNGEEAFWLNGVKTSHLGPGFPNGFWNGNRFTPNASGGPFEGFQWRNTEDLKISWVWLQNYLAGTRANEKLSFDHLVVAKSYIGCLS